MQACNTLMGIRTSCTPLQRRTQDGLALRTSGHVGVAAWPAPDLRPPIADLRPPIADQ